jgi:hypothetical protein
MAANSCLNVILQEWMLKDVESAFSNASSRKDKAFLTKEDYKVAVISLLGYKPTKLDTETLWTVSKELAGRDGKKFRGISKTTFIDHIVPKLHAVGDAKVMRSIFLSFDIHCRGFLTMESCTSVFKEVLPHVKEEIIKQLFAELDIDQDNRISFMDFELAFSCFPRQQVSTGATPT